MKKTIIVSSIGILLVVGALVLAITIPQPAKAPVPVVSQNEEDNTVKDIVAIPTGNLCFEYHQTATTDAPYTVNEYVNMTISGNTVSGTKKGDQAGPNMTNGYTGSLNGTLAGDTITVDFAYTVEGSQNTEQEIYKLTESGINKLQYQLIDKHKDGLVPDTTKPYTVREYRTVVCK